MTPKKFIGILLLIIITGVALWLFLRNDAGTNKNNGEPNDSENISSLFPFTGKTTPTLEQKNNGGATPTFTEIPNPDRAEDVGQIGALTQITNRLVAGYTTIKTSEKVETRVAGNQNNKEEALSTIKDVRFVERGTGYIYDTDSLGKSEKKVSQTTIVRSSEALFSNEGNSVIIRYIKNDNSTVATFLGKIEMPSLNESVGKIVGDFLPDDIIDITNLQDGKSLLFLMPTSDGVSGMTIKSDGTSRKQVFTSPYTEWLLQATKSGSYLTTKASGVTEGYSYKVTSSGSFLKQIGGILGLTTQYSPDSKIVAYSVGGENTLTLHYLSLSDRSDFASGLKTLPEKCIWGKDSITLFCGAPEKIEDGMYPDSWYQGRILFNDDFWKINTKDGTIIKLADSVNTKIDATKLTLSPDEKFLYFINKYDYTLWSLDLTR